MHAWSICGILLHIHKIYKTQKKPCSQGWAPGVLLHSVCSVLCVVCFGETFGLLRLGFWVSFYCLYCFLAGVLHTFSMYVYHSPPRFLNASIDMQRKAELEGEIKVCVHWDNWRGVLLILLMHVPSPSLHPTGCSEVSECV